MRGSSYGCGLGLRLVYLTSSRFYEVFSGDFVVWRTAVGDERVEALVEDLGEIEEPLAEQVEKLPKPKEARHLVRTVALKYWLKL